MHGPYVIQIPVAAFSCAQGSELATCLIVCRYHSCSGYQFIPFYIQRTREDRNIYLLRNSAIGSICKQVIKVAVSDLRGRNSSVLPLHAVRISFKPAAGVCHWHFQHDVSVCAIPLEGCVSKVCIDCSVFCQVAWAHFTERVMTHHVILNGSVSDCCLADHADSVPDTLPSGRAGADFSSYSEQFHLVVFDGSDSCFQSFQVSLKCQSSCAVDSYVCRVGNFQVVAHIDH